MLSNSSNNCNIMVPIQFYVWLVEQEINRGVLNLGFWFFLCEVADAQSSFLLRLLWKTKKGLCPGNVEWFLIELGSTFWCLKWVLLIFKDNFLPLNFFCRQTQPVTVNPVRRRSSSRMSMVRKANSFMFAFLWISVELESNISSLQLNEQWKRWV